MADVAAAPEPEVPPYPILKSFPPAPPLAEALGFREPAAAPPAGDADGDVEFPADLQVGGALSPEQEAILIKEAVNPMDDGWSLIQLSITSGSIPKERVNAVLAAVLQGLAKWGLPNIKAFLRRKFKVDGEEITVGINYPGEYGETALMQAAVNGRLGAAKTLIEAGANPNAQNKSGETALMWAAAYNELEMLKLLLKNKADPKMKDELGWTALMVASWAGNLEAVEILKSKSDKNATNPNDQTASDLAAVDGSPAKAKGNQKEVRDILAASWWSTRKNKKGGRHATQRRKKTNSKKRNRR